MSSNSSFEHLSDVESVKSEPETDVDLLKELEAFKIEFEAKLQKLTEKVKKMAKDSVKEESILTSIVGSWSIHSSIGMKEFIQKWKPSKINDAIFQVGTQNFECDNDVVTMYGTIGYSRHWYDELKLGVKKSVSTMFVENNVLVLVQDNGKQYQRAEYFVKNGQLHIVTKRFGLECTRVYEKIAAEKKLEFPAVKLEESKSFKQTIEDLKPKDDASKTTIEMIQKTFMEEAIAIMSQPKHFRPYVDFERLEDDLRTDTQTYQPLPITSAILGFWKLVSPSKGKLNPTYSLKNGNIVETTKIEKNLLVMDDEKNVMNEDYFLHTFVENNHLISNMINRKNGKIHKTVDRSIVAGKLKMELTQEGSEKKTFILEELDLFD